jgi:hypothetical protein
MKTFLRFVTPVVAACVLLAAFAGGGLRANGVPERRAFRAVPAIEVPGLRAFVDSGQQAQQLNDGRVWLWGGFTEVNGEAVPWLARVQEDGSIDPGFELSTAFPFTHFHRGAWSAGTDGRIHFATGDEPNSTDTLRRLEVDGRLDPDYVVRASYETATPELSPYIAHIVRGEDGRMLVAGGFDHLGGVAAPSAVALVRADGNAVADFAFGAPGSLETALALRDGKWLVITMVVEHEEGILRWLRRAFVLEADGALDPTFAPYVFEPNSPTWGAHAFAVDASGRLVFAEPIQADGSEPSRLRLGRLEADGRRDAAFAPELPEVASPSGFWFGTEQQETQIWLPPQVRQIVPDDAGALHVVAGFADEAHRGAVRVTGAGVVEATPFLAGTTRVVRRLDRGMGDDWWAEIADADAVSFASTVVRLDATGAIDSGFVVSTRAEAFVSRAHALADGGVVLEGEFDEYEGAPAPGVVWLDADGNRRSFDPLPWRRAVVVSVLADGGVIVGPPSPPAFITAQPRSSGARERLLRQGDPLGARIRPDGSVVLLLAGENVALRVQQAWTGVDDSVYLRLPGGSAAGGLVHADLVRCFPDGSLDPSFLVTDSVLRAAPAVGVPGGVAWVISYEPTAAGMRIHLVDTNGAVAVGFPWRGRTQEGHLGSPYAVLGVEGGVLVGGHFDWIDGVAVNGVARFGTDGVLDRSWSGWTAGRASVSDVLRVDGERVLVTGHVPLGERILRGAALDRRGLLDLNVPEDVFAGPVGPGPTVSPGGGWIMDLDRSDPLAHPRVLRWRAENVPHVPLDLPGGVVREGDIVALRCAWVGVPVQITWFRDGVETAGGDDGVPTFRAGLADDGAEFAVRLEFEDGSIVFSMSWRLRVAARGAWLSNGSMRGWSGVGEDVLSLGFVLEGAGEHGVLARALGPGLEAFGVNEVVEAVGLRLLDGAGVEIVAPRRYLDARDLFFGVHPEVRSAAERVGAWAPELTRASGDDQMLYPEVGYGVRHLHASPRLPAGEGVALAEVFTVSAGSFGTSRLKNLSGRARIASSGPVLIGGFVVEGDVPLRVLVRAVGPGLATHGVATVAADPRLTLFTGADPIAANDDWSANPTERAEIATAAAEVGAFALEEGSLDAALVAELVPGVYTVVVAAAKQSTGGVALVEVYVLE